MKELENENYEKPVMEVIELDIIGTDIPVSSQPGYQCGFTDGDSGEGCWTNF